MNLFKLFIILTFCGCESKKSEIRSSEIQDNGKILTTNNIIVGLYGGDLTHGEMMFDGDQELEYYSNDKYLGDSDNGVQNLYALLKITKSDAITIQNPATSFVGGLSHKPGLRDEVSGTPEIRPGAKL